MKRRLEIARGLLHHPKILFLDEPTLGLILKHGVSSGITLKVSTSQKEQRSFLLRITWRRRNGLLTALLLSTMGRLLSMEPLMSWKLRQEPARSSFYCPHRPGHSWWRNRTIWSKWECVGRYLWHQRWKSFTYLAFVTTETIFSVESTDNFGSLWQPLLFFLLPLVWFDQYTRELVERDYIQFLAPGIIIMSILFTATFSGLEVLWDRRFGFLKETLVKRSSSPFRLCLAVP